VMTYEAGFMLVLTFLAGGAIVGVASLIVVAIIEGGKSENV
jgi:hypothetical protein